MKRKHIILCILVFVIGGLLYLIPTLQEIHANAQRKEDFSLTGFLQRYDWIDIGLENKNVGEVNSKKDAIEKAKALWQEKYPEYCDSRVNKKSIKVGYDDDEECWHIYAIQPRGMVGGMLHAFIEKDGDVLAVWVDD